jgi:Holliday junction resolvasome RuvABC endonuclease subunit
MNLLAVDLGSSKVGWAYFKSPELIAAGTWNLEPKRHQSPGMRWLRFRACLEETLQVPGFRVDLIAYEEVRRHQGVDAAHAYGGAQAHLLAFCEAQKLTYTSVTIADIKRAATGKGGGKGTDKEAVYAAAVARWPRLFPQGGTDFDASVLGEVKG